MNSKSVKFLGINLLIIMLILVFWSMTKSDSQVDQDWQDQPEGSSESTKASEKMVTDSNMIDWDNREIYRSGLTIEAQDALDRLPNASVYHISLSIPDFIEDGISGDLSVRYINDEDVDLEEIYFRTFPNYNGGQIEIENIKIDGVLAEGKFESQDTALRIDLEHSLKPNESVVISMDFHLVVPTEMGGNYGLYGYFDDILVLDTFYPVIAAYDQNGWYKQIPQENGDLSYQDASFYIVKVKVPGHMLFATSGVEIEYSKDSGRQSIVYAAGPARDFYIAGSEKFTKESRQFGEITVNSLTFSQYATHQQYAIDNAIQALDKLGNRFGNYPYTEFDVISSPMLALGIEYPGVTSIMIEEFKTNATLYGLPARSMLESTIAHEVGHQWFYNGVGNDQQNEPWIDESLTQYATYLYYLDSYGENGATGYLNSFDSRWERVDYADIPVGMPAGNYNGAEYGAIVYGRGPLFFSELENIIGLDTLSSAIQNYYQENLWGTTNVQILRDYIEEECNCDLGEYFENWIYDN
ncbi:MAG: M1 family metallopeptidase [Chloroflexi bacterium]|jgi:hypothetical protein|nr:M1 family metallopeptidase [Chloroflexota bacterium]MBT4003943.1 M1 family metallopeptidase [Chloroflexota bacterium]MBT4305751.1 M1 family metallopeptidase [Chloroflexota bacterium]MBT4533575.1 M1 family metallopeptidase [Chloroflexota bacterium]MBT4681782.1 M1 family metallopeptidase [Chloroflexota bacterium]